MLVPRADSPVRFCIDFWKLNKVTFSMLFPCPDCPSCLLSVNYRADKGILADPHDPRRQGKDKISHTQEVVLIPSKALWAPVGGSFLSVLNG